MMAISAGIAGEDPPIMERLSYCHRSKFTQANI
jgi:hypothetical protein